MTYYAWLGNPLITVGTPHHTTGKMNKYGDMFAFDDINERDLFCGQFSGRYGNYPVKTTRAKAKAEYYAGLSLEQFKEYMMYVDDQPSNHTKEKKMTAYEERKLAQEKKINEELSLAKFPMVLTDGDNLIAVVTDTKTMLEAVREHYGEHELQIVECSWYNTLHTLEIVCENPDGYEFRVDGETTVIYQ